MFLAGALEAAGYEVSPMQIKREQAFEIVERSHNRRNGHLPYVIDGR